MRISIEQLRPLLQMNGFPKKKLFEYSVPLYFQSYWQEIEFTSFCDKARTKGILIFDDGKTTLAASYVLSKIKPNTSGVSASILCDFCFTLQARSQTALITFNLNREKTKSVGYYCCADLQCSLHTRGLTDASLRSKSQIREDITPEGRIARFKAKTEKIFASNSSVIISPNTTTK